MEKKKKQSWKKKESNFGKKREKKTKKKRESWGKKMKKCKKKDRGKKHCGLLL
jgi:hypothetical protein